jgi:hypothetical protein
MSRSDVVWAFAGTAYSASVDVGHRDVVRFRIPQMAAGTAKLYLQLSVDKPETPDSAATFVTLTQCRTLNGVEADLSIPCSDAAAKQVAVNPGDLLSLGRCRLLATDAGGVAVAQVAQVVSPILREL